MTIAPILTAILAVLCKDAILILLGRGLIPQPADMIVLLVCGAVNAIIIGAVYLKGASNVTQTPLPAPGPVVPPVKPDVPVTPDPGKPPVIVKPPATNVGIFATSFAGPNDSVSSSTSDYDNHIIRGATELGCALPYHFAGTRPHVVPTWNGKSVTIPIIDVGPWNTNDPYWVSGARPQAESGTDHTGRHTNRAGIDLTPAAWAALGHPDPNNASDKVDWSFADAAPPPVTPIGGTALSPQTWPLQSECPEFYGNPDAAGWEASNLVDVSCPWVLDMDGTKVHSIKVHRKCAASLGRVLDYVWEQCGKDQSKIEALHYHLYSGSFNNRAMRGSSQKSMHAYGCAVDWDDQENQQHSTRHLFTDDSLLIRAFKAEGWIWGGDWSVGSIDPMHVQAARVR